MKEKVDWSYFLKYADIVTPSRNEQLDTIVSLIPAKTGEKFTVVDLGCGGGLLSEKILKKFPKSKVIAADVSGLMLKNARKNLAPFGKRAETRKLDLHDKNLLYHLPKARCFVSSLAIHHLDAGEKKRLFKELFKKLDGKGAVLIIDLVEPPSGLVRKYFGESWDEIAKKQLKESGTRISFRKLKSIEWNHYFYPDDYDKPSRLFDQLRWLEEAGFREVDCFWMRAGHAVFGGFKQ
ncbi:MAG: class I SAM-dependent methyltransferase [Candidatus Aenigmarchaeota archaeon]|nr:class I SAM-dependent methyltransferase [Candidatus Aenigmarchaeota archaeon]